MKKYSNTMRIHQLMSLLSVVGEYPVCSLYLLGEKRGARLLVSDLTVKQEFWNIDNNEIFDCVAVGLSGKGKYKTIRLRKSAIPMLNWCGGESYYEETYSYINFSSKVENVDRNHRVAETVAMMQGANIEYRPWILPELQTHRKDEENICEAVFITSRNLKRAFDSTEQLSGSTRFTGALITPKDAFVVYNARNGVMKWGHSGEYKSQSIVEKCVTYNTQNYNVKKMILMGRTLENVMATISQSKREEELALRLNYKERYKHHTSISSIYRNVHYVPLSEFGQKLLKILTVPDYHNKLLRLVFRDDEISNGRDGFMHDAHRNGVYVLSFLDGDVTRLHWYKQIIKDNEELGKKYEYAILCYYEQREEVKSFMGENENITYPCVNIDEVLDLLFED